MKTNTYRDFKNFVVNNCVKNAEGKDYKHYENDTAHLIYSAWYMFKHQLNEAQCLEYLKEDYRKSRKHFFNHGAHVCMMILGDNPKYNEYGRPTKESYDLQIVFYISGGEYYENECRNWVANCMKLYNYWKEKLDRELNNAQ